MLVHVVSGMVFSRVLTVDEYGTYLQTFIAYDFAVPILTLGLPSALYYFLPGERERKKGLVLDNLVLMVVAGLIFSVFLILGGTELLANRFNNPELSKTLRWMIFYPLFTFPVLIGSAVWVSQDKVNLNAKYNVFTGLLLSILLIISVLITRSYEAPVLVRILLPMAFLPVALFLIFRHLPGKWDKPCLASMWNLIKFSVPLGLATVLGTLTLQLSNLVVAMLTSPKDFAIYSIGAKEIPLIGIVTGSVGVIIMADMANKIKNGDLQKALELFRKSAILSSLFLMPIMVFLFVFADSFIDILFSNKYEMSVVPFRVYLLMLPIRIVYYGSAFIALGKTKEIMYRSIVSLVLTGMLAYLLTMWFGYVGAAVAAVVISYFWAIPYNLITLSKAFSCSAFYVIPLSNVARIIFISLLAMIPVSMLLLFSLDHIISFTLGLFIYALLYSIMANRYVPEFADVSAQFKYKLTKLIIKFK